MNAVEEVKSPSERAVVLRRLAACGMRMRPVVRGPEKVLRVFYIERGMSLDEIGAILKVTRQAVAYNAEQLGIETGQPGRPETMLGRIRKHGFEKVGDYFRAHATKTFEAMALELSVSSSTVQRHYQIFLSEVQPFSA